MKKMKVVLVGGIVFFFTVGVYLYAQKPKAEEFTSGNPEYLALTQKLDEVSAIVQKTNAETIRKLDQVLNNQAMILKELAIVKVRASRSR